MMQAPFDNSAESSHSPAQGANPSSLSEYDEAEQSLVGGPDQGQEEDYGDNIEDLGSAVNEESQVSSHTELGRLVLMGM